MSEFKKIFEAAGVYTPEEVDQKVRECEALVPSNTQETLELLDKSDELMQEELGILSTENIKETSEKMFQKILKESNIKIDSVEKPKKETHSAIITQLDKKNNSPQEHHYDPNEHKKAS